MEYLWRSMAKDLSKKALDESRAFPQHLLRARHKAQQCHEYMLPSGNRAGPYCLLHKIVYLKNCM